MSASAAPATPSPRAARAGDRALSAVGVQKTFGGFAALKDVSLDVAPGSITGLIGPNGSGKTTLINVLSGVLPPSEGYVRIGERDITDTGPAERAELGIARTFQNIRLFGHLSVLENVEAGQSLRDHAPWSVRRRPQALAYLDEVGISALADRQAGTLSYGDQRRLEIARALATGPSFLLLDEPAAGLLPAESESLLGTLRRIREVHGTALLVIDHDLRLISRLCESVVVLNEGRRLTSGTPAEVQKDERVIEAYLGHQGRLDSQTTHEGD